MLFFKVFTGLYAPPLWIHTRGSSERSCPMHSTTDFLGIGEPLGCVEGLQTASPCQVVTVAACAAGESYPEYREKLRGGARGDQDSAEHQGPVGARPLRLWDTARTGTEAAAAPGLAHILAAPASLSDPCP